MQQQYRFDGILINLPGRDPNWREYVERIEDQGDEKIIHSLPVPATLRTGGVGNREAKVGKNLQHGPAEGRLARSRCAGDDE